MAALAGGALMAGTGAAGSAGSAAAGVAAALGAPCVGTLGFVFCESALPPRPPNTSAPASCGALTTHVCARADESWTGSASALNTVKGLAAGGLFFALAMATGLRRRVAGRQLDVAYLVLSGFVGITVGDTCWLQALQMLGARRTVLLDSLKPFVAWVFGALFLKERNTSVRAIAGLALTVFGVALVAVKPEQPAMQDAPKPVPAVAAAAKRRVRRGYALAVLNMLMDTSGSLLTRQHGVGLTPFDINAVRFGSAGLSLAAAALAARLLARTKSAPPPGWAALPAYGTDSTDGGGSMGTAAWGKVCAGIVFCTVRLPLAAAPPQALLYIPLPLRLLHGRTDGAPCPQCLCPTLNNFALFRLPLATAVTLGATGPLFALPITWLVRGESVSSRAVTGAATAVAGVAMLAFSTPV